MIKLKLKFGMVKRADNTIVLLARLTIPNIKLNRLQLMKI